jgi:hypothetical protein
VEAPEGVWAWRRGEGTVVALNHGAEPATVSIGAGQILLGSQPGRTGERTAGEARLNPWECLVIATTPR